MFPLEVGHLPFLEKNNHVPFLNIVKTAHQYGGSFPYSFFLSKNGGSVHSFPMKNGWEKIHWATGWFAIYHQEGQLGSVHDHAVNDGSHWEWCLYHRFMGTNGGLRQFNGNLFLRFTKYVFPSLSIWEALTKNDGKTRCFMGKLWHNYGEIHHVYGESSRHFDWAIFNSELWQITRGYSLSKV